MIADQTLDAAANAFRAGAELIADAAAPNGRFESAPHGTALLFTGTPIPLLNAVLGLSRSPDAGEIAALAERTAAYAAQQVPWTIRLRGSADSEVIAVAAGHGLTVRTGSVMMLRSLSEDPGPAPERVRKLPGAEYETFANVLGAAFGAPPQIISGLYNAATLDRPELDAYVLEEGGAPRTVGLAVRTGDHLYLANIATHPDHRRRGHALALTTAMLRDGQAAGARTAFLHSANDTVPLFERAGFETGETWTTFAAG
ncbi:Acetyltransferase (GNAT) family protein [Asanoa hainanensis]|uniref:Acetyltransferase (GNAT) family protein n=1 Tax=Asanoa hainanensis TaxID=560556 RepID=A0A239P8P7_9ACTN|nr:GNAT family N-acetyltransferase [Asanoa hainanensis]SNT63436.1 Acetyltransferase (GNAT) family protein [Asanoa hainanensis]